MDELPAPDGEEYYAMALLFAANRWGSGAGIYDYAAHADRLLRDMVHREPITGLVRQRGGPRPHTVGKEVNDEHGMILFSPDERNSFTDASYHLPAFYELWARWGPEADRAVLGAGGRVSRDFFVKAADAKTGLVPNLSQFDGTPLGFGRWPASFREDAWRVAMNWSVDWSWWGKDPRQRELSDRLQAFFESQGMETYGDNWKLDGTVLRDRHSPGLVATSGVASLAATDGPRARKFTEALWNLEVPSSKVFRYYDGLLYFMSLLHASGRFQVIEPKPQPVNPRATPEARQLLDFLHAIRGKHTLAGQHNFIMSGSRFTGKVQELTGKRPLLWGTDFSFAYEGEEPFKFQHCGPLNLSEPGTKPAFTDLTPEAARDQLVKNAIQAHRDGFIVTLMWHACPPGMGDACDGKAIWTLADRPSLEWWDELTTDGTKVNHAWKAQADVIAGYLKQLKDARVPVLWRPYHEMNGVWFWWCNKKGENGFKKLWVMMYERYVKHHQLDNLIWVWNTNAPRDRPNDEAWAYEDFWPGLEYVDVLAADVYRDDWKPSHHDDLVKLGRGKPIVIGECAPPPALETLARQPSWAWYMPWGNLVFWGNGPERTKALLADPRILTREDVTRGEDGVYRVKR